MAERPSFVIEESVVQAMLASSALSMEGLLSNLVAPTKALARPPISRFFVGAVGLGASGRVFLGVNLEFAGLPLSNSVHAEQFLVANAAQHGERDLRLVAVSAAPCGHCRQFLQEIRGAPDLRILIADTAAETQTLAYFLPHRFGPNDVIAGEFPLVLEPHANGLSLHPQVSDSDHKLRFAPNYHLLFDPRSDRSGFDPNHHLPFNRRSDRSGFDPHVKRFSLNATSGFVPHATSGYASHATSHDTSGFGTSGCASSGYALHDTSGCAPALHDTSEHASHDHFSARVKPGFPAMDCKCNTVSNANDHRLACNESGFAAIDQPKACVHEGDIVEYHCEEAHSCMCYNGTSIAKLRAAALEAANGSHAPYTNCPSGIALLTQKGKIYSGSYMESVAYNPSLPPLQSALVAFVARDGGSYEDIVQAILVEKEGAAVQFADTAQLLIRKISPSCRFQVHYA